MILGYGLAALTKPIFPLASSIGWVFGARFVDRMGKGIRGAPRDALVADIAAPELRGAAYGLRQALDSVGAFLGPVLAVLAMAWFADNIRSALWVAVLPAFIAVALLVLFVKEPGHGTTGAGGRPPLRLADVKRLPLRYWLMVLLGAVFTLARFSEAFLVLRAQDVGLGLGLRAPGDDCDERLLCGVRISGRCSCRPLESPHAAFRRTSSPDRRGPVPGCCRNAAHDVCRGWHCGDLHLAFTQGLLSKLVADTSPALLRGTAFGVFNLVSGVALLLASTIAGALWSSHRRFGDVPGRGSICGDRRFRAPRVSCPAQTAHSTLRPPAACRAVPRCGHRDLRRRDCT